MSKTKNSKIDDKTVAILATHGFEESELRRPLEALRSAGAEVHVLAPEEGEIRGWSDGDWSGSVAVDRKLAAASPDEYDALVLPGGVMNPDALRTDDKAVALVRAFLLEEKPVAAICHGPWTLIETGLLEGRQVTSWPSLRSDLANAGARWSDEEVVVDRGLITSRDPRDLPAFEERLVETLASSSSARVG